MEAGTTQFSPWIRFWKDAGTRNARSPKVVHALSLHGTPLIGKGREETNTINEFLIELVYKDNQQAFYEC